MAEYSGAQIAEIISYGKGIYTRVARQLRVSQSMVSKVANRERISPEIDAAIRGELNELKKKLATYE